MSPLPRPLRIGPLSIDPPILQAPMAGFTDHAFRQIVRRFGGVGLLATEMLSARGLKEIDARGRPLPDRLWGVADEPRPLAVQIWDNDPRLLAAIGRRLVEYLGVSVIDINFGCPTSDVAKKAESGSYLLGHPDRIGWIVAGVVEACAPVPVTAKIRLGQTAETINAIEVAQAIEEAGGAAVTVHGRTAAQLYRGAADWQRIAEIRPHLRGIPLIGNGDLRTPQQAAEAMTRYGVDGVMIGRAALGRPWLFRQTQAAFAGEPIPPDPTMAEQRETILAHYRLVVEQHGPEKGTILMRRYACRYLQGHPGARAFRSRVARAATAEEFGAIVGEFFAGEGAV